MYKFGIAGMIRKDYFILFHFAIGYLNRLESFDNCFDSLMIRIKTHNWTSSGVVRKNLTSRIALSIHTMTCRMFLKVENIDRN